MNNFIIPPALLFLFFFPKNLICLYYLLTFGHLRAVCKQKQTQAVFTHQSKLAIERTRVVVYNKYLYLFFKVLFIFTSALKDFIALTKPTPFFPFIYKSYLFF